MRKKILIATLAMMLGVNMLGCTSESASQADSTVSQTEGVENGDSTLVRGHVEDTFHTQFFDLKVDSVWKADTFGDLRASEGKDLVIVGITVNNVGYQSIDIRNKYFQLQWGDGDDDFSYPLAKMENGDSVYQFVEERELGISETYGGYLVYEVPEDYKDYWLVYQEAFSDGSVGNTYACFFTPSQEETGDVAETNIDLEETTETEVEPAAE